MRINSFAKAGIFMLCAVFSGFVQAAEESSAEPGVFSGYAGESIWTLVWFVVLIITLRKFAWKPLLASLKAREEHISSEIKKAEQTNKAASEKLAEYEKKIAQIHQENQAVFEKQLAEAKLKGDKIIGEARKEAELINDRAKEEINRSIETARKKLFSDAADIVFKLGSEVLSRTITPQDNRKLIDESIEEIRQSQSSGEN